MASVIKYQYNKGELSSVVSYNSIIYKLLVKAHDYLTYLQHLIYIRNQKQYICNSF